ncbi:PREDICTED: probable methyltransferase PMT27 [Lupinus angustifolius]|uniref:probable methyltransferase PMT27 n=1 Tax=Lupinus angustifolius TaxID=3871 RepID=UPI00092EF171|nr:PREDICTED: probable methyltransferase PMT27 [Lupinus angustifolius]
MAPPPKSRNNRRSSSSSSYTSTLTTLLFVSICVLAIWMLSSNSAVSPNIHNNDSITDDLPQTTTTTTTTTSAATARSRDQKDPDDPIKSADRNKHHEVDNDLKTTIQDNSIQHIQSHQNPEQSIGGEQDVPSFDTQGYKNNELEVKQNEQKQNLVDDSVEIEKPKEEKKRRKPKKESKKPEGDESEGEKERQREESDGNEEMQHLEWHLCNVTAGADFIPCLDNEKYLKTSHRRHYEHRERHCPEDAPTCLVPLPQGYKTPVQWPNSRDKIWYHNVPHTKLAEVKGHQNWVKLTGEFLTFPGGGTQFIHGALHYIDFLQQAEPGIAWGKHTRVILDVGCGVGSFGGFLFERDVIAMSFAPKDEHEAQVQFALERGIPAISAVMGTQRLQFPSSVFDLVHCARCRVPWHEDGGLLLLELNRVLRPGGFFVWSATPVYQTLEEDVDIWKKMSALTKAMCWELVTIKRDKLNQVGAAFYRKPTTNECYEQREKNEPPMCKDDDDPNDAWYVPLQACMHRLPVDKAERGTRWPETWPLRLQKAPYWLNKSQKGVSGKLIPQDFAADNERWKNVVDELSTIGISWSNVRNIMDMHAVYGGFAAALKDLPVWVFNVVNTDSPNTLPIIYERGLIGIYHDWCESFSTYPRTYDLLHADHLFSKLKKRCNLVLVIAEVDRIVRPGGKLIVRDDSSALEEVENLLKSLHWEITSKNQEGVLLAKKGTWRSNSYVTLY